MPTYVNKCNGCGHTWETQQSIKDDTRPPCPKCEGQSHRVVYPPTIHFIGPGFYCTDRGTGWNSSTHKRYDGKKAQTKVGQELVDEVFSDKHWEDS